MSPLPATPAQLKRLIRRHPHPTQIVIPSFPLVNLAGGPGFLDGLDIKEYVQHRYSARFWTRRARRKGRGHPLAPAPGLPHQVRAGDDRRAARRGGPDLRRREPRPGGRRRQDEHLRRARRLQPDALGLDRIREIARDLPENRLLVETDSPFLAPVPYRGKRNEPAYVARVVEQLATLRGTTVAAIGEETDRNFERLFRP